MQQHQLKGSLMLFFCALIWGLAFVAQSVGADHVGAFTFNGLRSLIGAVFLSPASPFLTGLQADLFLFGVLITKQNSRTLLPAASSAVSC